AFYLGWIAFLLVSVGFLWMSWNAAMEFMASFRDAPFVQRLLLWRYTLGEPWNVYGLYMGNANKMSNYLVIFLLLSVTLLAVTRARLAGARRAIFFAFWFLAAGTLIILFSRAALLLLPIAFLASGTWRQLNPWAKWSLAAAFLVLIVGVAVVAPSIYA